MAKFSPRAKHVPAALVFALSALHAGLASAALQGRDLDGNAVNGFEAYYDTAQDLTWLADANAQITSGWKEPVPAIDIPGNVHGFGNSGYWVRNLSVNGVTGWRLPKAYSNESSELSELYKTLGNAPGTPLQTGGFSGMAEGGTFWTTTPYTSSSCCMGGYMVSFNFSTGMHGTMRGIFGSATPWAVHDGDVAAVPEPSTMALMGLGLVTLACRRSRRRAA